MSTHDTLAAVLDGLMHPDRVDALVEAGWTINPSDVEGTKRQYERLTADREA